MPAFADELRAAGHPVTVPDLFEGATFDTIEDRVAYTEQVGVETILERGRLAAQSLPDEIVYAGARLLDEER